MSLNYPISKVTNRRIHMDEEKTDRKKYREFENKVREVLGTPEESRKKVGQTLSRLQKDYHLKLPAETLKAYGIEEKFKMTFKNSWWQLVVAVILFKPMEIILTIVTLYVLYVLDLSLSTQLQEDLKDFITVVSLILMILLARHLAHQSWKRKQKRASPSRASITN